MEANHVKIFAFILTSRSRLRPRSSPSSRHISRIVIKLLVAIAILLHSKYISRKDTGHDEVKYRKGCVLGLCVNVKFEVWLKEEMHRANRNSAIFSKITSVPFWNFLASQVLLSTLK